MSMEELIFDLARKPLGFWVRWIFLISIVIGMIYFFTSKKQRKLDVKTRNWRRFIYTNCELLQYLNDDEKVEMLKVFDTTVQNAELFSQSKQNAKNGEKKEKQRIKAKK